MANPLEGWEKRVESRRKEALAWWSPEWRRFEENYRFFHGEHYAKDEIERAKKAKMALLNFNDLAVKILAISGREMADRFKAMLLGVEGDDPDLAKAWTAGIDWVVRNGRFTQIDSAALLDVFVCGVGVNELRADFMEDLDGKIVQTNLYPWEVAVDPSAKEPNLEDKSYLFRFREMQLEDAKRLFPTNEQREILGHIKDSLEYHAEVSEERAPSDRYKGKGVYDPQLRTITIQHYQERVPDDVFQIAAGDGLEAVPKEEFRRLATNAAERGLRFEEGVDWIRRERYAFYQCFRVGDQTLKKLSEVPAGDWSYNMITCWPFKQGRGTHFFCPVDVARDPYRWRGKSLSLFVDIMSVSPKAPVFYEEGAFVDENEAMEQMSAPMGRIRLSQGALQRKKVEFGSTPRFPPIGELMGVMSAGLWDVLGISPLSMGQITDVRRAPAQSIAQIQRAGQTVFAMIFDNFAFYKQRQARTILKMIAVFLSLEIVGRAVGKELGSYLVPAEMLPQALINPAVLQGQQGGGFLRKLARSITREQDDMAALQQAVQSNLPEEHFAAVVMPVDWKRYQAIFGKIDLAKVVREALRYDIAIDEGADAATEAERLFEVLPQLLGVLKDSGFPVQLIPDLVIGALKNVGLFTSEQADEALRRVEAFISAQQPAAAPAASGAPEGGQNAA